MVPPSADEPETGEAALRPPLVPPRSVMFADTTMEPSGARRPAVIPIDPPAALLLPPSAVIAFEIVTAPSEFTLIEPPGTPTRLTGSALMRTTNPPVPRVRMMMPPAAEFPPVAVSFPLLPTVSLWARISNVLEPPTKPPLCSVTSRVPKSNVQVAPAVGGVTVAVRLIVHALAVQDALQAPLQPLITSVAVQTAAACRAGATSTPNRTSRAATTPRLTGTLPSCRCGTG